MYQQHFGLKHAPLGKQTPELWDDGTLSTLQDRFQWLLESPGVGLLTGTAGVGKTAALRQLTQEDLYRGLALALGVEPAYRRAQLWRDIKARIQELADGKQILPLWIIDEAQNLPTEFFRDFPAFLNFAFDSRDLMTVWLVGHPLLARTLDRAPYAALASRLQARVQLNPIIERERFKALIEHALQSAGCSHTLLADSGMELLRQASQGLPRHAGRILKATMQMAVPKGLNHLPDELLQQAIEELR